MKLTKHTEHTKHTKQDVQKLLLKYIGLLILTAVQVSCFAFLWYSHYVPLLRELRLGFFFWGNIAVIGLYLFVLIFFNKSVDAYKSSYMIARHTCIAFGLATVFTNMITVLQTWMIGRYYFNVVPMMIMTAVQVLVIVIWSLAMKGLYLRLRKVAKVVVIHGTCPPNTFKAFLEKSYLTDEKLYTLTVCDFEKDEVGAYQAILSNDQVILYDLPSDKRNAILKFCYENAKDIFITPKISDILMIGAEKVDTSDTPLLKVRKRGLPLESLFVKRVTDIILSSIGLIIVSPFLLISALVIKLYDGGSVFYRQERLTRDGKQFDIIKFRSMRENSEKDGPQIAKQNDKRITPYGKFLRATHLDELPQLINILKGDMTFVGPRPERVENIEKYEKIIPEFRYRLVVKAGLTGYAQIYGKYDTTPLDKIKLDLEYIEKHSLWLDIKLIILTFKIIFHRENAEGVTKEQDSALLDEDFDKKNND